MLHFVADCVVVVEVRHVVDSVERAELVELRFGGEVVAEVNVPGNPRVGELTTNCFGGFLLFAREERDVLECELELVAGLELLERPRVGVEPAEDGLATVFFELGFHPQLGFLFLRDGFGFGVGLDELGCDVLTGVTLVLLSKEPVGAHDTSMSSELGRYEFVYYTKYLLKSQ